MEPRVSKVLLVLRVKRVYKENKVLGEYRATLDLGVILVTQDSKVNKEKLVRRGKKVSEGNEEKQVHKVNMG